MNGDNKVAGAGATVGGKSRGNLKVQCNRLLGIWMETQTTAAVEMAEAGVGISKAAAETIEEAGSERLSADVLCIQSFLDRFSKLSKEQKIPHQNFRSSSNLLLFVFVELILLFYKKWKKRVNFS